MSDRRHLPRRQGGGAGFRVADAAIAGQAGEALGYCATPSRLGSTRCPSWRCLPQRAS